MKIGIIITTYQKLDGSSPSLLKKAIDSIKNQTHQDYTLIVIGDKYEDDDEFKSICNDPDLKGKIISVLSVIINSQKYDANIKLLSVFERKS